MTVAVALALALASWYALLGEQASPAITFMSEIVVDIEDSRALRGFFPESIDDLVYGKSDLPELVARGYWQYSLESDRYSIDLYGGPPPWDVASCSYIRYLDDDAGAWSFPSGE